MEDQQGKHKDNDTQEGQGKNSKVVCNRCHKVGHISKNCWVNPSQRVPKIVKCYNCNQSGHMEKDCKTDQLKGVKCCKYNQYGHIKRECPELLKGG